MAPGGFDISVDTEQELCAKSAVLREHVEGGEVALPGVGVEVGQHASGHGAGHLQHRSAHFDAPSGPGILLVGLAAVELDEHAEPSGVGRLGRAGTTTEVRDRRERDDRRAMHAARVLGLLHPDEAQGPADVIGKA